MVDRRRSPAERETTGIRIFAFLYYVTGSAIGVAFAAGVMWALSVLIAVLVCVDRRIVAREEPYLERRFGQEYRDNRARARRWL